MARRVYARRYAQAVFQIALERDELDKWQSDLSKITSLGEDAVIATSLENPKLHFDEKVRLLSKRLIDINPLALNLTYLLITRGRLGVAGDIADEYQRLLNSHHGIEQAEVTTAIPLDDKDKLKLAKHLGTIVRKKVELKPKVDSSVIGGVVTRIGGKLIDGSTRSKLETLKKELAGTGR